MMARRASLADVPVQGGSAVCKARLRLQEELSAGDHRADHDGRLRDRQFQCRRAPAATASPIPRDTTASARCRASGSSSPASIRGFRSATPWGSIDVTMQGDGRIDWRARFDDPAGRGASRRSSAPRGATIHRPGAANFSFERRRRAVQPGQQQFRGARKPTPSTSGRPASWRYDGSTQQTKVSLDAGRGVLLSN